MRQNLLLVSAGMDWLAGGERRALAVERIYDAAARLIAAQGFDRFNVDDIAAAAGCSRATVYRHVGGKRDVRDAVLGRALARIAGSVRESVDHLAGQDRAVAAILDSLRAVRADPVTATLVSSRSTMHWVTASLVGSPRLTAAAAQLAGLDADDPLALDWLVRVVLALLYWPLPDPADEEEMVRRFVAPLLGTGVLS